MIVNDANIYAQLDIKASLVLGNVVNADVERLEVLVANYYKVSVVDLRCWRVDSDAKKMICFLLRHQLNYSIGSIANRYGINRLFLRKCIVDLYVECLRDDAKKSVIDVFLSDFKNNNKKVLIFN